jgi:hypothetical protein
MFSPTDTERSKNHKEKGVVALGRVYFKDTCIPLPEEDWVMR